MLSIIGGALLSAAVSALISAMVGLALALILDALMNVILKSALQVAFAIAAGVMDPKSFSYDVETMFGAGGVLSLPELGNFNILSLFKTIGYSIIIINTVVQILKSLTASATGDRAKNPAQVALTSLTSVVLMVLMFGFGNVHGLIYWIGTLMSRAMDWTLNGMGDGTQTLAQGFNAVLQKTALSSGIQDGSFITGALSLDFEHNQIVQMIFAIAIASGVISAAFSHVERYITIIIFMLFGPVAIGFGSSDDTKDSSRQWFTGLLSQYLAILLSLVVWRLFFISVAKPWTLFQGAVTLALLSLIKNSEQILNSLGFRTMPSGETARSFLGASTATAGALRSLGNTLGAFAGGMTGAALGGLRTEGDASAKLYAGINNAKDAKDVANAQAEYRRKTAGLFNGFRGRNPELAYSKAVAKYGAVTKDSDVIANKKKDIDTMTANKLKNAKNQSDISAALNKRQEMYNSLPGNNREMKPLFNNVSDEQLKTDALANVDRIGNKSIADPQRASAYAAEQASLKKDILGLKKDEDDPGSSIYNPSFGGYANFNNGDDGMNNIKAPQLNNPYLTNDNLEMSSSSLQSVKDFNNMMSGERDNLPQGTLSEALDLNHMGSPMYDYGTLQGTMSGNFGDCDGYSCGITQLRTDDSAPQMYAVVPDGLVLPEGTTFACNPSEYSGETFEHSGGEIIITDAGMQLIPLSPVVDTADNGYNSNTQEVVEANGNITEFFNGNVPDEFSEIDLEKSFSKQIDNAFDEADREQIDSYYDYVEESESKKGDM